MTVYVSFLRGINVGGNRTIRMGALKALFESLGLARVKTHLNSGNVVFAAPGKTDPAKLAKRIEDAIEKAHGFRPTIVLRDIAGLQKAIAGNPFREEETRDPSHLLVMFLADTPDKNAGSRLANAHMGPEKIRVAGRDVYLCYPNGIGRSKLTNAVLERELGVAGTARNWNTVRKLLGIAAATEGS